MLQAELLGISSPLSITLGSYASLELTPAYLHFFVLIFKVHYGTSPPTKSVTFLSRYYFPL